jgi:photosystem II stability/assembly factor-like uncharacterized protein
MRAGHNPPLQVRLAALAAITISLAAQPLPPQLFDALRWRMIGPFRGGRVNAVTASLTDRHTFYFGAVGGGIWKTTNSGVTWEPVFDDQPIASIGALEVAPSNPNIIYAGTGEADMRSDICFGNGVYKSTDAGATWTNIGLRDSRQIGRIVVHPTNPELVYVAALGHAYGPNAERGVYRSSDGGRTWRKVLDKGPDIGAVDLAVQPENPSVLYATMWRARRTPWSQYPPMGGPGSGLYKSVDGGDTWTEIRGNGLPSGEWGRSGVAVARGTSGRRVYALIDATSGGGLYRSDDAGATWTHAGTEARIYSRGWYFGRVTADPKNPDVVYLPNIALYKSADAGRTYSIVRAAPGGDDYHMLWIDPSDSSRMILGTDQGTTISVDGGKSWSTWYNQPTGQFYHVATDNQFPYLVYGAQQDSGAAAVPSRSDHDGITDRDFRYAGRGESGWLAPDPKDPNIVYTGDTLGSLSRVDMRLAQSQNITPWPISGFGVEIAQRKYRFPWTAPLVFSPFDPATLYFGAQFLLKTIDGGLHWREISPDLTGDERKPGQSQAQGPPTIENARARGYGVIYSIAPSSKTAGLIWAGSDTGLIHLTRDEGKTWSNVTPSGLGPWSKITHIEASHFEPAIAYAAVDRHRLNDYKPYLYRTRDFGRTWTPITNGLAEPAFLNAIREDPARRGLLFAASDLGISISFDDGDHWQPLKLNLPTVSVRDLAIKGDDLVIATHGRAFWILDSIGALRQIDSRTAATDAVLIKPATAIRITNDTFQGTPLPIETPKAANPPDGAIIDYYLRSGSEEITLEFLDAKGQIVRRFSSRERPETPRRPGAVADVWLTPPPQLTARAGLNRFVWDLRYAVPGPAGDDERGPHVLPGLYQARLTVSGRSYTQPLTITLDPRSKATSADLAAQHDLGMRVIRELARLPQSGSASIRRQLLAVLGVVTSADRRPPAQAEALFQEAQKAIGAR